MRSRDSNFGIHFPSSDATRAKNIKTSLEWAHRTSRHDSTHIILFLTRHKIINANKLFHVSLTSGYILLMASHFITHYATRQLWCGHGLLTRYATLWVAHAPGMPESFPRPRLQRKPLVNDPGMHHVRDARALMHVGIANLRWWRKTIPAFPVHV